MPLCPQPASKVTCRHSPSMLNVSWVFLPKSVLWLLRNAWPNVGKAGICQGINSQEEPTITEGLKLSDSCFSFLAGATLRCVLQSLSGHSQRTESPVPTAVTCSLTPLPRLFFFFYFSSLVVWVLHSLRATREWILPTTYMSFKEDTSPVGPLDETAAQLTPWSQSCERLQLSCAQLLTYGNWEGIDKCVLF